MQRYFVKKENEKIVLSSQDLHHIKDVMRIKSNGQIVCVFDNASYLCKIEYDNNSYDVKIIEGANGNFIAMPSKQAPSGEYRDIVHPLNTETREQIFEMLK